MNQAGYPMDIIYFQTKKKLYHGEQLILRTPSRQLFFRFFIFRSILKVCRREAYDFIYIRYARSDRYFLHYLRMLHSLGTRIFIEFPTYPYDDELDPKNLIEKWMVRQDRIHRDRLHRYADYAVSTVELDEEIFRIPTFRIDNGIDLTEIKLVPHHPLENELRLIGVANLSRWHAWDRVLKGLADYYRDPQVPVTIHFTIIGTGTARASLEELARELKLESRVTFAGPKTGEELDEEFSRADVAVGTLGLHRIGLASTSVLKLREYTARGFPSLIGYREPVVSSKVPFICSFPADDSALDMEKIVRFYRELPVTRSEIRQYAEDHFSWGRVFKPLLEKL